VLQWKCLPSSIPVSESLCAGVQKKSKAEKEKIILKITNSAIARVVNLSTDFTTLNTNGNKDHIFVKCVIWPSFFGITEMLYGRGMERG